MGIDKEADSFIECSPKINHSEKPDTNNKNIIKLISMN